MGRYQTTRGVIASAAAVGLSGLIAGCGSSAVSLQTSSIAGGLGAQVAAPPLETYERIASKAATCWFGPEGRLTPRYIFHASAPAPSEDKPIRISLNKRLPDKLSPWGAKAYVIELSGTQSTFVDFRNIAVPLDQEGLIKSEVLAWANGRSDCTRPPPALIATVAPAKVSAKPKSGKKRRPTRRRPTPKKQP